MAQLRTHARRRQVLAGFQPRLFCGRHRFSFIAATDRALLPLLFRTPVQVHVLGFGWFREAPGVGVNRASWHRRMALSV